ncbi:MAG TPA: magnesium chelatase ATPase subunit D [Blastocatellia bacterium]|nr:magnesium chelatase ATPase subunit D [Blastocatellia bacterium]
MGKTVEFPFTAIIGCEAAKRALLLLAIDPGLKGVLIGAGPGSAKSTLARAFATVSSESDALMTVPANITTDNLIGGLDVERTLAAGERVYSPGLLTRADGGVLFVEDINSLEAGVAAFIASALGLGSVKIEREGFSSCFPSRFLIIGAYDPADGLPSSALINRVGMIVEPSRMNSADERAEIISRSIQFRNDPQGFAHAHAKAERDLKAKVAHARTALPNVEMTREQIKTLARAAVALGIVGNLADLFAVKAARASAALIGRDRVEEEDLLLAIQLVLIPRAVELPQLERRAESITPDQSSRNNSDALPESDERAACRISPVEDLIIKAVDASAPEILFERMRALKLEAKLGKRGALMPADRGRAVTSQIKASRQSKVALFPTLCAAAPFQAMRRKRHGPITIKKSDIRYKRFKSSSGILFIFAVDASGSMAVNRMAQAKGTLGRVLQKAYLYRDKVALISFRGDKADLLLPPTRSIERAKSLIDSLPAGGGTPVAAALVRALELAKHARIRKMSQVMIVLLTDGRANVRSRLPGHVDRMNQDEINEELKKIGRTMRSEAIESVVIDTKSKFVSSGEARNLAEMLGGKYLYLPRAGATGIHEAIESVASTLRENHVV